MTGRFAISLALLLLGGPVLAAPAEPASAPAPVVEKETEPAVDAAAERAAAERLVAATRMEQAARERYRQQVADVMGKMQSLRPEMPGRAFDIIEEEFTAIEGDVAREVVDAVIDMYMSRFSAAEMDAIADFYETDVGRKALDELPALANSGAVLGHQIGRRLGEKAGQRALQRMREQGIDPSPKAR